MKPSCLKSNSKGQYPSDMQGRTDRSRPPLKTVKKDSTKPDKLKCKPLTGKVFYLDISSNVLAEKIAKDLKELGGRVEGFFSKDINYIISNKKEAKFAHALGQVSPVPSPESTYNGGNSSPHPNSRREKNDGNSFKVADTVCMSRGKSLVEKAIKEQELIPSGSILSNALSCGVKILHVDDIKSYIDQKKNDHSLIKKSSTEIRDVEKKASAEKTNSVLKNPFLKVEDRRCNYRPFFMQLSSFPVVNYSIPKPCSPFDVDKKNVNGQKQIHTRQRAPANHDKEKTFAAQLPAKHKKRKGYCECCMKKYDDLQAHLESVQHQNFAHSSLYQVVDDIISQFACDFVHLRENAPKTKRRKFSVGQLAPLIGTNAIELKEQLKRQDISLRWYSRKNVTMNIIKEDSQRTQVYHKSPQKISPTSEPACSLNSHHTICSLEVARKVSGITEGCKRPKSSNLTDTALSANLAQLPLQRDSKRCLRTLPEIYEHCEPIARQNLQSFPSNPVHSQIQNSQFSERNNPANPKQKPNNSVLLPTKCLKNSTVDKDLAITGVESNIPRELSVLLETEPLPHSLPANKEHGELMDNSSPSIKLSRKVKNPIGRNNKGNQKQKTESFLKRTGELSVLKETRNVQSSSTQTLLELFQTSDANSDFGGFSSMTENKESSLIKDTWVDQHTDALWSLFSSSASSSPFIGF